MIIKKNSHNPIFSLLMAAVDFTIAALLFVGNISRGAQILLGLIFCLTAINELMKIYHGYLEWKLERQLMEFIHTHISAPPVDPPSDKTDDKEVPS